MKINGLSLLFVEKNILNSVSLNVKENNLLIIFFFRFNRYLDVNPSDVTKSIAGLVWSFVT